MRRRTFRGGAFAAASAGALCLFALGCAQAGFSGHDGGTRDHGVVGSGDLGNVDLLGADLTGAGGDAGVCDPLAQSGCTTGEKCTLASSSTACVADGDKLVGQACGSGGADDCQKGNLCVSESMTAMVSQCRQFCATDGDCKQPAQGGVTTNIGHCIITLTGAAEKVCTVACQPVVASGLTSNCATGLACQVFATMTIPQATDCATPGAGVNNADCTKNGDGDCAAGYTCVTETLSGGGTQDRCRKICRSGTGAGDCAGVSGTTCLTPTGTGPFPWGFCEPP